MADYGYTCPSCDKDHDFSVYSLAQLAMGHDLIHKCGCGETNDIYARGFAGGQYGPFKTSQTPDADEHDYRTDLANQPDNMR